MHYSVNELFLTALRVFLEEAHDLDAIVLRRFLAELLEYALDMGDCLRLVVLNGNCRLCHTKDLLDDGCSHNDLLTFLEKGTEVGSKIRLALATIDNQHVALLSRRRGKFHVSRECGTTETYDTAHLDFVHDDLVVICEIRDESIGTVNAFCPLVAFHLDFNAGLHVACQILAGSDGLHCSGNRRMYICGNESARFSNRLSCKDLVANCNYWFGGSADMLRY